MILNYIKIALRNIKRQKGYSFINIFGLAAGISACILISAYIINELNYDEHHQDEDRIYRINLVMDFPTQYDKLARNSMAFGPQFKQDYAEAESFLRIMPAGKQTVTFGDKKFNEEDICYADSNIFKIFTYESAAGNLNTALEVPGSVVISEKRAEAYFGSADEALDKVLKFQNKELRVTGVYKESKDDTHLHYKFFISLNSLPEPFIQQAMSDYIWMLTFTYIKVKEGASEGIIESRLNSFVEARVNPWLKENNVQGRISYLAQPVKDIHLNTSYSYDYAGNSNPMYITIFLAAGLLILIIACFNYINLITARSLRRIKEIGIRKVLGAERKQLILQFLGESVIITLAAYAAAFLIISLLLPQFNELTGKNFSESDFFNRELILPLIYIFLFISLMAGSYPAFYLSRFQPNAVLKMGAAGGGNKKSIMKKVLNPASLRRILVVVQFAISIILIIGTAVIYNQFTFMREKNLGFNPEQILVIDIPSDTSIAGNLPVIKNELLADSRIAAAAAGSNIPGTQTGTLYFNVEVEGQVQDKFLNYMFIDDNYLNLMKIPVITGRNFSREFGSDQSAAFIINEAAANFLNMNDPIGKKMANGLGVDGEIVGVVKDFNYASLHNPIEPLVMMYSPVSQGYMLIKTAGKELTGTVEFIKEKWSIFDPAHPMESYFLDENFDKVYKKEENMLSIFGFFAAAAIVISCMGLLGLASYIAEQKTKEIGIRKVLGASTGSIAYLISKDFIVMVLLSNILAVPAAYYMMNYWLKEFAYRTDIGAGVFIWAAAAALIIAAASVSVQAVKAALTDPVKSIKYE